MAATSILKMIRNFCLIEARYSVYLAPYRVRLLICVCFTCLLTLIVKQFLNFSSSAFGEIAPLASDSLNIASACSVNHSHSPQAVAQSRPTVNTATGPRSTVNTATGPRSTVNTARSLATAYATAYVRKVEKPLFEWRQRWVAMSNKHLRGRLGARYTEYLAPTRQKFLIIFSIDVAAMGQRWRTFWFGVAKMVVEYVISTWAAGSSQVSDKEFHGLLASIDPTWLVWVRSPRPRPAHPARPIRSPPAHPAQPSVTPAHPRSRELRAATLTL